MSRTFLVTGASSGIGRAIAESLLTAGHRVIGVSRQCQQFTHRHAGFSARSLDLADLETIAPFAKQLLAEYPQLDGVILAAGYGQFGGLEQFSTAQIQQLMTVNFTANACLVRALLPALKRQAHSNLIVIGSEAALKGARNGALYCASKFALRGFTQALREECGKSALRVSLINPGMVETPFFDALSFGPVTALQPADIAAAVAYIVQAGPHAVIDEITLNPATKVIDFKKHAPVC